MKMNTGAHSISSHKGISPITEETKQKLIGISSEDAGSNMQRIIKLLRRSGWENILTEIELSQIVQGITGQLYDDKKKNLLRHEALVLIRGIVERRQKIATLGLKLN